MTRTTRAGAALVAAYIVAAVLTMRLGPLRVRPLYEGTGTVTPYEWVNPPKALAKGNIKPKAGIVPVAWTKDGNEGDSPSSTDAQAFVSFPDKAIAPRAGDDGVDVRFTPVDALTLRAALPAGLRPDGNAYGIEVQYTPSATPVTTFAKPPLILLRWATGGSALLYSPDGTQWQRITKDFQVAQPPDALMSAEFAGNGYYLAASHGPLLPQGGGGGGTPVVTIVIGALIVLPIIGIVWFVFPRKETPAKTPATKPATKKKR